MYKKGKKDGNFYSYYKNNYLKRKAVFENDSLISEIKYNEKGLEIKNK